MENQNFYNSEDPIRWSAKDLLEQWPEAHRSVYPEFGEVSDPMYYELQRFMSVHAFDHSSTVQFNNLNEGLKYLEQSGWDLSKISFELEEGEIKVMIEF